MSLLFDTAIHLFKEVSTHVLGHVFGHKAIKSLDQEHFSANEGQYLAVRDQLAILSSHHADNIALQEQRLALEKQQLALQTQLSKDYLAHLHTVQQQEVELRVQEIQANYDNQHWAGVLSRQETLNLLTQTAAASQTRLLMVVSEPDVSDSCPAAFQHDLGKEVRGKLKRFLESQYPAHSDYAIEFYGKFFKSAVFDTEVRQIEHVLAPLHLATIFSDVTRKEIMFHLRLWLGTDAPAFSLATAFPWKEEHKRLIAEGMDEEDSLEAVQDAIVAIHQLLAGMLADIYFLWLNPLHEPRLFTLVSDKFPVDWLETVFSALRDVQAKRLAEYEHTLREKEQAKELVSVESKKEDEWQTIGKYKVKDGLAVDTETGLMWCRFTVGQTWTNNMAQGQSKRSNYEQAFLNANDFNDLGGYDGYTDWRLPTINELKFLSEDFDNSTIKKNSPFTKVFPEKSSYQNLWSSSLYKNNNSEAWLLMFRFSENSRAEHVIKNTGGILRLVRSVR